MEKKKKKSIAPRETKRFLIRRSKGNTRKPGIAKRQGENNSDIKRMRAIQKKAKSQKKKIRICVRSERTNLENDGNEDFLCVTFIVLILCVDSWYFYYMPKGRKNAIKIWKWAEKTKKKTKWDKCLTKRPMFGTLVFLFWRSYVLEKGKRICKIWD